MRCGQCGEDDLLCSHCHNCSDHCFCGAGTFDADELGLDPETDIPERESRYA